MFAVTRASFTDPNARFLDTAQNDEKDFLGKKSLWDDGKDEYRPNLDLTFKPRTEG
jgi:hypothetical protein